ncbi:Na+/H+ antiporter NhaC [Mediannikoviicoccus vaginalis]|uniref:Na+/H+ antiporter NhaC n=1 Tax=Mediannikoviicoccus vaginalis TaxID=2899727 RepID=UPI001F01D2E2|nr:Na+/H+ antiporter NhaC [Mediannikoviicoccus vaginalis]
MENIKEKKRPEFGYAIIILLTLAAILVYGLSVIKAPLAVIMFIAWIVVNLFAIRLGYKYKELEKIAIKQVGHSLQSVVIMLAVGMLISSWIASGTVPTIIYYGLKIINPDYYLVTTLVICAIVSMFTGTSWGTIGTVGVALLGIGISMGIHPGMIAGALISGSWFGDKLSPLSDTTNFQSGVMGVPLMTHIKHMLYTTVPSFIVSAILFFILGRGNAASFDDTVITQITGQLDSFFKISFITLIPLIVVIVLLIMQRPASQSILIGAILGMALAIFYQGFDAKMVIGSGLTGFNYEFNDEFFNKLLNRGGMDSMTRTIQALIFTTGLGGMLREMDILKVLVDPISKKIKSDFALIFSGIFITYLSIALTGSHMFASIMVQSTMLDLYKKNGLKPENASRITEDCGTLGVTLIPYGVTALFIVDTLGIDFATFFPYTFFCFLCPIFNLLCGLTGIGIARYTEEEMREMNLQEV